jgi:hypothetical protein
MNWAKRVVNYVFKDEVTELHEIVRSVSSDFQMIPYTMGRQRALVEMIGEMDPQLFDLMLRMSRDYSVVSSAQASDTYRQTLIKQSRAMYLTDPVYSFGVKTWTDFGFSQAPSLAAADEGAGEIWAEFWTADRNAPVLGQRKLHKLSDNQVVDGELFFAIFASTLDGQTTVRTIEPTEIKEILYDPNDKNTPLYYRRDYAGADGSGGSLYYPDWTATDEQLARANLPTDARLAPKVGIGEQAGTDVKVLHVAFREIGGRGWPLASTGMDWENVYSGFLKDRAAVAKAAASVVEKVKVKGGQRALDAVRAGIGSSIPGGSDAYERNPPPVAGSVWLENDALQREWMNRPTGAADAEKDGQPLITQVGLSFGLFPHWLGRGEYYRLATATAMEMPVLKSFNRYQNFWASVWQDMFKIVIGFAEKYGGKSFSDKTATISSNRIITLSQQDIAQAVTALNDMTDRGLIDAGVASEIGKMLIQAALETMGISGAQEMLQPVQPKEAGESHVPFRGK